MFVPITPKGQASGLSNYRIAIQPCLLRMAEGARTATWKGRHLLGQWRDLQRPQTFISWSCMAPLFRVLKGSMQGMPP